MPFLCVSIYSVILGVSLLDTGLYIGSNKESCLDFMSNAEDDVYTMCIVKCHLVTLFFDPLKDAYVFTEFPHLSFLCRSEVKL